jgi:hypothetical protein
MKMYFKNINATNTLLAMSVIAVFSCTGNQNQKPNNPSENKKSHFAETANTAAVKDINVKSADGLETGVIQIPDENNVSIKYGSRVLFGERKGDKFYYTSNDPDFQPCISKSKENTVKIKKNDGTLIWKVKIKESKITISDNEENNNAYELKINPEKIKVEKDGTEIGKVVYYSDKHELKLKNADNSEVYSIPEDSLNVKYGVLLCKEIPFHYQLLIMAELLRNEKGMSGSDK